MDDDLPALRLNLTALDHNIALMARWCRDRGVALCPHVKTTMTWPIVERQLAAGAWGVTVATVRQAGTAVYWGVRRIVIANEVVHPPDLAALRRYLDAADDLTVYCFVDSVAGVQRAAEAMVGAHRPLHVLVDVGTPGGRTGVREPEQARAVAQACAAADGLILAGVAGYEGVRPNRRDPDILALVDAHCRMTVTVCESLLALAGTDRVIFTMGGSAFPDRVLDALAGHADGVLPILRSGCYVTHDHGTYAQVSPVPGLRPALSVRAVVLSAPEPGRAVVGAGKRELPYDAGLPVLLAARDATGASRPLAAASANQIFDHHLILDDAWGLAVGDIVDLGISHPCSAFDRWPDIAVVDDCGEIVEHWHTRFR
ncbi:MULTISPECIES: alanine racemase [unclassified Mycolicibacterium]|uniref:alanine racemase n=1 Tax=unclassified Mycolicibacterium TaxID=2636767 RepID=UPI0012DF6AC7|nr:MULTISPECIES: alanine racemase [unclassified Mycolicibacterium]MUL81133.1 hypothetical protein [Mycolicibacterium sp. CBMA 329]MUL86899.1 hypothetical protein [Mycolicibacterium sp. CBMA 331]MUL98817.1 hypothetical protein [Mycolicibacterium sp. CBMA 334]MUM30135.1 hypothetical protein [Mycolicibacterium sp. CBMA 295]MUM37196.1 hypothetical protein [Mycolicibacterium sp. CBMA 247]